VTRERSIAAKLAVSKIVTASVSERDCWEGRHLLHPWQVAEYTYEVTIDVLERNQISASYCKLVLMIGVQWTNNVDELIGTLDFGMEIDTAGTVAIGTTIVELLIRE
jgi:hypothetical protein